MHHLISIISILAVILHMWVPASIAGEPAGVTYSCLLRQRPFAERPAAGVYSMSPEGVHAALDAASMKAHNGNKEEAKKRFDEARLMLDNLFDTMHGGALDQSLLIGLYMHMHQVANELGMAGTKQNGSVPISKRPSLTDLGYVWVKLPGAQGNRALVPIDGREQKKIPWHNIPVVTNQSISREAVHEKTQELLFAILNTDVTIENLKGGESYRRLKDYIEFFREQGLGIRLKTGEMLDFSRNFYLEDAPREDFRPRLVRVGDFELAVFQVKSPTGSLPTDWYFCAVSLRGRMVSSAMFSIRPMDREMKRLTGETVREFMLYVAADRGVKGHEALYAILCALYNLRNRDVSSIFTNPGWIYKELDPVQYKKMVMRHVWTFFTGQGFEPEEVSIGAPASAEIGVMTAKEAVRLAHAAPLETEFSLRAANVALSNGRLVLYLPRTSKAPGPDELIKPSGAQIMSRIKAKRIMSGI